MLFFSYICTSLSAYNHKEVWDQLRNENRLGREYINRTYSTNQFHDDMKQIVDSWRQQFPLSIINVKASLYTAIKYVYCGSIAKAPFYVGLEYVLNTASSLLNLFSTIINMNKNYLIKNLMKKLYNSS